MGKYRTLYGLAICAALVSYILADRAAALVILCVLVVLPIISLCVQCIAMQGMTVSCAVRSACHVGKTIHVVFTLQRTNRLPLGIVKLDVLLSNVLFGDQLPLSITFQPEEEQTMVFEYPFPTEDCGAIRIRSSSMVCYDLLGLFCWHRSVDIQTELRVYPRELKLELELEHRPETKSFGTMYDPYKKGQDVSEVAGLRDYVPGDTIHRIHWKLSSKMDKTIVREFGSPTDYNTLILYELAHSDGKQAISHARNNVVLALTAALSYSMLERGLEHEMGRMYEHRLRTTPVRNMREHEQLVDEFLYMPVNQQGNGMDTVFAFLRGNASASYTKIIYITPIYEEQAMRQLAHEANLVVLHVVEGTEQTYDAGDSYSVIPVNVEDYETSFHTIVM
jgi:uncharacterized protein (DUF58 family)